MRARLAPALVAALLVAPLVVAACGGTSGSVTAADTPAQRDADEAVARSAVLRAADVPAGYNPRKHRDPEHDEPALLECTRVPRVFVDAVGTQPRADSPDFTAGRFAEGPAQLVQSNVVVARSSEDLRPALGRLADANVARCFEPYFRARFAQGLGGRPTVTTSGFAVRPRDIGRIGDQRAAFQGTVTMHTRGGPVEQDLNLYFVRSGRALVTMYAAGNNEPFDEHLAENLLSTIASRL